MKSPLIFTDIIDLDDLTVLQTGVNATSNHNLVLVNGTRSRIHNVEEHRGDQLPFLGHDVVSHTRLGDLSYGSVKTTYQIDEPLIVCDGLFVHVLHLKLVRDLMLLEKDFIIVIVKIQLTGFLQRTSLQEEDRVS